MELELKNRNLKHNLQANGWKEGEAISLASEMKDEVEEEIMFGGQPNTLTNVLGLPVLPPMKKRNHLK